MSYVGGDLFEATYNHPVLGSGTLFYKSNEEWTFDHGGLRTNDDANQVAGNGEIITQLNRVRWFVEGTVANDMTSKKELQKVKDMAAHPQDAEWTWEPVNGQRLRGTGRPVGDLTGAGIGATFTLKVSGGGQLVDLS